MSSSKSVYATAFVSALEKDMSQPALEKIAREHTEGLVFAAQLKQLAQQTNSDSLAKGVALLRHYNETELEQHLQHEEQAIFLPLMQQHPEQMALCIQLGKEHGRLRTLAETITSRNAAALLAEFAELLESHTLLENEQLLPLVANVFTPAQLDVIAHFKPLEARTPLADLPARPARPTPTEASAEWLETAQTFLQQLPAQKVGFILLPRFEPRWSSQLARHLGLDFFNFQREIMAQYQAQADQLALDDMTLAIQELSALDGSIFFHAEALLCVKSEAERRAWFEQLLQLTIQHPILIPLSLYQGEVPDNPAQVCDLELAKLPRY